MFSKGNAVVTGNYLHNFLKTKTLRSKRMRNEEK